MQLYSLLHSFFSLLTLPKETFLQQLLLHDKLKTRTRDAQKTHLPPSALIALQVMFVLMLRKLSCYHISGVTGEVSQIA